MRTYLLGLAFPLTIAGPVSANTVTVDDRALSLAILTVADTQCGFEVPEEMLLGATTGLLEHDTTGKGIEKSMEYLGLLSKKMVTDPDQKRIICEMVQEWVEG